MKKNLYFRWLGISLFSIISVTQAVERKHPEDDIAQQKIASSNPFDQFLSHYQAESNPNIFGRDCFSLAKGLPLLVYVQDRFAPYTDQAKKEARLPLQDKKLNQKVNKIKKRLYQNNKNNFGKELFQIPVFKKKASFYLESFYPLMKQMMEETYHDHQEISSIYGFGFFINQVFFAEDQSQGGFYEELAKIKPYIARGGVLDTLVKHFFTEKNQSLISKEAFLKDDFVLPQNMPYIPIFDSQSQSIRPESASELLKDLDTMQRAIQDFKDKNFYQISNILDVLSPLQSFILCWMKESNNQKQNFASFYKTVEELSLSLERINFILECDFAKPIEVLWRDICDLMENLDPTLRECTDQAKFSKIEDILNQENDLKNIFFEQNKTLFQGHYKNQKIFQTMYDLRYLIDLQTKQIENFKKSLDIDLRVIQKCMSLFEGFVPKNASRE